MKTDEMCLLLILYKVLKGYPIIALHNRYAETDTCEHPPRRIKNERSAFCPMDVKSRGTWVGFNDSGLFVAVTDQHTKIVKEARRSRGKLVVDLLIGFKDAESAISYLKNEVVKGYKRANFIVLDKERGYHLIHDEELTIRELQDGIYVVTNFTPIPGLKMGEEQKRIFEEARIRERRAYELAEGLELTGLDGIIRGLMSIARDHEHGLSELSICYHGRGERVMSSSTIVAIGDDMRSSKIFYCRGNPCKGEFVNFSHIISSEAEIEIKSEKLRGRKVALCVTGSVAAVEAPKLARELRRHGAEVHGFMTKHVADCCISPKLMEWATGNEVVIELSGRAEHLTDFDAVLIYPATLNTVCKIAQGIADNAVTTLCASIPMDELMIAPAMSLNLYSSGIFQENISKLKRLGAIIIPPRVDEGAAKVAPIDEAVDYTIRCLSTSRLRGRRVVILAGPTSYNLDPVRCIISKATGRIGYWLSREAFQRGCEVTVIYGPGTVDLPRYVKRIDVTTTEDMLQAAMSEAKWADIAIFSAAILDFKPEKVEGTKVKSGREWNIKLVPTPKVIKAVREAYPDLFIVAFKLEYKVGREELLKRAKEVKADIVVANDLSKIIGETHEALIIDRDGRISEFRTSKRELAGRILDAVERYF